MNIEKVVFNYAKLVPAGGLHFKNDPDTGLKAIIAIHSTALGPSLGGCRCLSYNDEEEAIFDAIRLATGMSYKAALANVATGGGKAVLIKPEVIPNHEKYFASFGKFVEQLGGKYITAIDSGTSIKDMDIIAQYTSHIASLTTRQNSHIISGDPAPYTAFGVYKGLKAAVKFKLGKENIQGLTIAIQGVGNVGYLLAELLHKDGAKLIVADTNEDNTTICQQKFQAKIVSVNEILFQECDVLSPCALGGILHKDNIMQIKAKIIAGAANNQLLESNDGKLLLQQGILYTPDYLINAGGLIFAHSLYTQDKRDKVIKKIEHIYTSSLEIFNESKKNNLPTNIIADNLAKQKLALAEQQ